MKGLRIKSKARFFVSLFIFFCIFHTLINFVTVKVFSYQEPQYEDVIISKGDTLWSIAKRLDGNIQENIYQIQKINNLDNCSIYVGQTLKVPISS